MKRLDSHIDSRRRTSSKNSEHSSRNRISSQDSVQGSPGPARASIFTESSSVTDIELGERKDNEDHERWSSIRNVARHIASDDRGSFQRIDSPQIVDNSLNAALPQEEKEEEEEEQHFSIAHGIQNA